MMQCDKTPAGKTHGEPIVAKRIMVNVRDRCSTWDCVSNSLGRCALYPGQSLAGVCKIHTAMLRREESFL